MSDSKITQVIFRKEGQDVIAFFPELPGTNNPDSVTCYAHVGQHASAHITYVTTCKPATPAEYADLKAELESLGYTLHVIRRLSPRHRAIRLAALRQSV